jgi:hypothetical protein
MPPILLKEFFLDLDIDVFLNQLWLDPQFYEGFLINKLSDLSVNISKWIANEDKINIQQRNVRSFHPSKLSFPGLPSHCEVYII